MDLDKYIQKTSITQYKTDIGFRTLVEGVNEGLYVIPKYQRRYRWDKNKVIDLVDSLICGLPIPPIYTWRNADNQLEILDGQQRVMSLFFYYIGYFMKTTKKYTSIDFHNLEVRKDETFENALKRQYKLDPLLVFLRDDDNKTIEADYSKLSPKQKRRVDYTTIPIVEIKLSEEASREDVLRKIFANLNKNGVTLTPQEQRNGIYNCKFYDMLHSLNQESNEWRSLYGALDSKSADVQQLLRFCALKKYAFSDGIKDEKASFGLKAYKGKYEELLDSFSNEAVSFTDEEIATYKNDLTEFFNLFALTKNRTIAKKKAALVDGLYVVYELMGIKNKITDSIIDNILKNQLYKDSTSYGTSSLKNMTERWQVIYEIWSK